MPYVFTLSHRLFRLLRHPLALVVAVFCVGHRPWGGDLPSQAQDPGRISMQKHPAAFTLLPPLESPLAISALPRFPLFLRQMPDTPAVESLSDVPPQAPDLTELLLTFDDGPNLETTPLILDELDRRGIKAIFFVSGHTLVGQHPADRARRHMVRKLAAHGHMVANHTISHANLCKEKHVIDKEIDGNEEILTAATGVRPLLFRSPYGARCRALHEALVIRGIVNLGWNIDAQEWKNPDGEEIARTVTRQIKGLKNGRGVILLHDTKHATVDALPRILDWVDTQNRQVLKQAKGTRVRFVDYDVFLPPAHSPDPVLQNLATALATSMNIEPFGQWARKQMGL